MKFDSQEIAGGRIEKRGAFIVGTGYIGAGSEIEADDACALIPLDSAGDEAMVFPEYRVGESGQKEKRNGELAACVFDDVARPVRRLPVFRLEFLSGGDDAPEVSLRGNRGRSPLDSRLEWIVPPELIVLLRSLFSDWNFSRVATMRPRSPLEGTAAVRRSTVASNG